MNWYEWTEERRNLLVGGVLAICGLALVVCARRNPVSFDSFWHLRMGLDWVENELSPWTDHYSFTFQGAEISSVPVLFQAALYWFVSQFGEEPGYQLLKFVLFSLTLGLVIAYLKQIKAPVFVYCIVFPLLVALIELRAMVRPELFSYSLIVAAMMLYRWADCRVSARTVIPIALLMWFWCNYHSPVIGYVIFFGFFIDSGVHQLVRRAPMGTWFRWFAWGVLVVVVGVIRPGWSHPLYNQLLFDPQWLTLIQEYTSSLLYMNVAAVYALIIIGVISLWLSVRQHRFGYVAIILILAYAAFSMARLVTPAGITLICIFSHVVTKADLKSWLNQTPWPVRVSSGALILAVVSLSLWTAVSLARAFMFENKRLERLFPSDVVMHMEQSGLTGRIFNEYQIGGYLIYRLAPESKVYIDGRTNILYPIEHYNRMQAAQMSPEVLLEEVEKYDISLAVIENLPNRYWLMSEVEGFGLEFVGSSYSLYVTGTSKFPVFGRLLSRPACWSELMVPELKSEEINATIYLLGDSQLWPFLGLVMGYSTAADKSKYIADLDTRRTWDDSSLRFVAHRALEHGEFNLAVSLLAATIQKQPVDLLAAAWALMQVGKLDQAEHTLRVASQTTWTHLELPDFAIMHELIQQLRETNEADSIEEEFVAVVRDRLDISGLGSRRFEIRPKLFCTGEGWQAKL